MSVEVTFGDTPCAVVIRPWTIQGCRPFSVSNQPAVLMRNGAIANQGAIRRNHLARSSFFLRSSHMPHSANRKTSEPR